jgi:hypothetical protein
MENTDKGLPVPKWVLMVRLKMPQNLSAQFVRPRQKVLDFNEKRLHWASVVRGRAEAKDELPNSSFVQICFSVRSAVSSERNKIPRFKDPRDGQFTVCTFIRKW